MEKEKAQLCWEKCVPTQGNERKGIAESHTRKRCLENEKHGEQTLMSETPNRGGNEHLRDVHVRYNLYENRGDADMAEIILKPR